MSERRISVLVVDDDAPFRRILERELVSMGFDAQAVSDGDTALERVRQRDVDVCLLDVRMEGMDGIEALRAIRGESPQTEIVMLTGHGTVDTAVHAMKLGAYDFLSKPCRLDELASVIEKACEKGRLARENVFLRRELSRRDSDPGELIGRSAALGAVKELVARVAPTGSTVLVRGESGVGKELVARSIHRQSERSGGPFVVLDCTALQEGMLHSELFGHERGAFTGASSLKHGLFEVADGGTLLLDEIGELPPELQTKLLRVLESGCFRRLGGVKDVRVDTRAVAATNRDLDRMVREGSFREDLYYRINVVTVAVPPLRERREDIPLLAHHFVAAGSRGGPPPELTPEALSLLQSYDWPGNVRELHNVIERALILCRGPRIEPRDLPLNLRVNPRGLARSAGPGHPSLDDVEREYLAALLDELGGSRKEVARAIGVSERTLYRKLRQHGLGGGD